MQKLTLDMDILQPPWYIRWVAFVASYIDNEWAFDFLSSHIKYKIRGMDAQWKSLK